MSVERRKARPAVRGPLEDADAASRTLSKARTHQAPTSVSKPSTTTNDERPDHYDGKRDRSHRLDALQGKKTIRARAGPADKARHGAINACRTTRTSAPPPRHVPRARGPLSDRQAAARRPNRAVSDLAPRPQVCSTRAFPQDLEPFAGYAVAGRTRASNRRRPARAQGAGRARPRSRGSASKNGSCAAPRAARSAAPRPGRRRRVPRPARAAGAGLRPLAARTAAF